MVLKNNFPWQDFTRGTVRIWQPIVYLSFHNYSLSIGERSFLSLSSTNRTQLYLIVLAGQQVFI